MRLPLQLSLPSTSASTSTPSTFVLNEETGELVLIELQGELELSRDRDDEEDAAPLQAGQRIGKLDLSIPGRPTLLIGHHRLIGKVVKLNTPMAILKHTQPPRIATPSSSSMPFPPPSSSSPIRPEQPTKRARSSSLPDEANEQVEQPASKRVNQLAAPQDFSDAHKNGLLPSSPLPPSSASIAGKVPPQTPINVAELKKGKHEIVGILRQKLIFSKRPEPVVKLDVEEDE